MLKICGSEYSAITIFVSHHYFCIFSGVHCQLLHPEKYWFTAPICYTIMPQKNILSFNELIEDIIFFYRVSIYITCSELLYFSVSDWPENGVTAESAHPKKAKLVVL